ncbi:N,N-dimethylformamidase beta subunit family domain-containing protein [Mesorhizobium sp. M1295]|uniref:N,N-dimethylformamidase beta subunit family domain-containing protein n=1 Tax=Mesorhizobium sp. M1295 TaxID=2957076 RepID=UPI003338DAD9
MASAARVNESTTTTTGVYNYTRRPGAPQEVLTGGMFWYWELFGGPSRPKCGFTVCDPEHWVFTGAGVGDGDTFGAEIKLLGHEADGLEVESDSRRPKLTCPTRRHR